MYQFVFFSACIFPPWPFPELYHSQRLFCCGFNSGRGQKSSLAVPHWAFLFAVLGFIHTASGAVPSTVPHASALFTSDLMYVHPFADVSNHPTLGFGWMTPHLEQGRLLGCSQWRDSLPRIVLIVGMGWAPPTQFRPNCLFAQRLLLILSSFTLLATASYCSRYWPLDWQMLGPLGSGVHAQGSYTTTAMLTSMLLNCLCPSIVTEVVDRSELLHMSDRPASFHAEPPTWIWACSVAAWNSAGTTMNCIC